MILNLGCGTKTSERCLNIDWSPYLVIQSNPVARRVASLVLGGQRLERLKSLPDAVKVHDLRKGIPAADDSVDAVYHSHILEHIDRSESAGFLAETRRVLRPGGTHRIVVPDLEKDVQGYLKSLSDVGDGEHSAEDHEAAVGKLIEQMVRRESWGTSQQAPLRRKLENVLLGDARKRGETHQWAYDRVTLTALLESAGFREASVVDYSTSRIEDWDAIGLDRNESGGEYKPGSLYMEAIR